MDGLLLTGGADISQEFLRQPVPDPSVLEKDSDPARDEWEFAAVSKALERGLPILAICKGCRFSTSRSAARSSSIFAATILPEQKDHDIQPLRIDRHARIVSQR